MTTAEQRDAWTKGILSFQNIKRNVPLVNDPQRHLVISDLGLRIKATNNGLGKCKDGANLYGVKQCVRNFTESDLNASTVEGRFQALDDWPTRTMVNEAAKMKPDVIVSAGDYLYRQGPCPEGSNTSCVEINKPTSITESDLQGTVAYFLPGNWGDNWFGWWSDFFYPTLRALKVAPIIAARGNHEACSRGGHGYFLLLDPREYSGKAGEYCTDFTEPYGVLLKNEQFLVFDVSFFGDERHLDP